MRHLSLVIISSIVPCIINFRLLLIGVAIQGRQPTIHLIVR